MEGGPRRSLLGGTLGFRHRKFSAGTDLPSKNAPSEKPSVLEEFFEALESTVALLRIRSQPCTFSAVSSAVESLTKRRFLHSHLAKIKHLFPEALECDSFTWKDMDSASLKTDIRIKLLPFGSAEAKGTKSVGGMSRKWSADTFARRREFQKRLAAFKSTDKEEDDIPEAPLLQEDSVASPSTRKSDEPDTIPITKSDDEAGKQDVTELPVIKSVYEDIVSRRLRSDDEIHTSHFPVSFSRHFSRPRKVAPEPEPAEEQAQSTPAEATAPEPPQASIELSQVQGHGEVVVGPEETRTTAEPETPQTCIPRRTSHTTSSASNAYTGPSSRCRPYSLVASVDVLPKLNPDATPPKRQSVVKKSLQFDDYPASVSDSEKKILDSLPDDLLNSIREKERKALEDQGSNVVQVKRRQQMLSGLPHFFNMTRHIFQSQRKSVLLHTDLVEQIKSSSTEITDTGEIEDRLSLLIELASEWISPQTSLTGERLYRVQKTAEFSVIRKRILDAT